MEVALLEDNAIKIKGKNSSFIINPSKKIKQGADGVLFLSKNDPSSLLSADLQKEVRVIIQGTGEYELAGVKISGTKLDNETIYDMNIDNMQLLIAKASSLENAQGKVKDYDILLCDADREVNSATLLSGSSKVIILYGQLANEVAKEAGKEDIKSSSKYQVTSDKIPMEVDIIVLA